MTVDLKAQRSDWMQHQKTNDNGEFDFSAVPLGEYTVTVTAAEFRQAQQAVVVASGTSPVLHFQLELASLTEETVVTGESVAATMDSVTPTTLLNRQDVQETPGQVERTVWPSSRTTSPAPISHTTGTHSWGTSGELACGWCAGSQHQYRKQCGTSV